MNFACLIITSEKFDNNLKRLRTTAIWTDCAIDLHDRFIP